MTNPKNRSTLASWQLISLGASFLLILGLTSCGSPQKLTESSGDRKVIERIYKIVNPKGKPQKITITQGDANQSLEFPSIDEQNLAIPLDRTNLQKISDKEELPDSTVFDTQSQIVRQTEARNNVGSLNRASQAYYLERGEFTSSIAELGIGVPDETTNYKYTIDVIDKKQLVKVIATSKKEGLKSYLGVVFLVKINNQDITQATVCESLQPTTATPPRPSNVGLDSGTQACPDGYRDLSR